MISKPALPMPAPVLLPVLLLMLLPLAACAGKAAPGPVMAVPARLACPAPAQPPAALVKRPAKIDFLPPAIPASIPPTP